MCLVKIRLSQNPQLLMESANCWRKTTNVKRNPQIVSRISKLKAEYAYFCVIELHLRIAEQLPIFSRWGIRNKINMPIKIT